MNQEGSAKKDVYVFCFLALKRVSKADLLICTVIFLGKFQSVRHAISLSRFSYNPDLSCFAKVIRMYCSPQFTEYDLEG